MLIAEGAKSAGGIPVAYSRWGGVAALVAALAALGVVGLEARRSSLGFADADDPRVMPEFFRQHADLYTTNGLLLVLVGISLAVAVLALWRANLGRRSRSGRRLGCGLRPVLVGVLLRPGGSARSVP